MKKHSGLILSFVIFGLIGIVALAWGAGDGVPSALTDFQLSNNVEVDYSNDGLSLPQAYGTATKHTAGDRIFGTTESSNIYYLTGTTASAKGTELAVDLEPTPGLNADSMTGTWGGTAL